MKWTSVKVTDFMSFLEVDPKAAYIIMQHCYDGYTINITFTDFLRREENVFDTSLFSKSLPIESGSPMWLVNPHLCA
jgi:DMSO/TMAO reductase YedYZ molybdopterin-dependent catalytic subunit